METLLLPFPPKQNPIRFRTSAAHTPEFRDRKNAWVLTAVPLVRRALRLLTHLRRPHPRDRRLGPHHRNKKFFFIFEEIETLNRDRKNAWVLTKLFKKFLDFYDFGSGVGIFGEAF
jgi:hypothetical protein